METTPPLQPSAASTNLRNGTYANVAKKLPSLKHYHRIILKPTNVIEPINKLTIGEIATIQRSIEKSLGPQEMDFNFIKMKPVEDGSIMVTLPSKQDQLNAITN